MHCKILLKYYGEDQNHRNPGAAALACPCCDASPVAQQGAAVHVGTYCNEWDRIIAVEHAGQSILAKR